VLPRAGLDRGGGQPGADRGEQRGDQTCLDGNPATFWHTKYIGGDGPAAPHLDDRHEGRPDGVGAALPWPRPATGSPNGTIGQYRIELSLDGTAWGTPVATGTFVDERDGEKTATFTAASAPVRPVHPR